VLDRCALFLCGGLLISLGDRVHLAFGVLEQADDSFLGQAWWVLPSFGLLTLVLIEVQRLLRSALSESAPEPSIPRLALACLWFLLAYSMTGPLDSWGPWLGILLAALWLPRALALRSRSALLLSLLLAVAGPLGEAAVSAGGRFHYLHPDWGSVPSWLYAIYLHGALAVYEIEGLLCARRQARAAPAARHG